MTKEKDVNFMAVRTDRNGQKRYMESVMPEEDARALIHHVTQNPDVPKKFQVVDPEKRTVKEYDDLWFKVGGDDK